MEAQGKYTLRRVAGGVAHFARVGVVVKREGVEDLQVDADTSEIWLNAARRGIKEALAAMADDRDWVLASFVGTVADTSADDAWLAAVMAVLSALEVEAALIFENGWVVVLPSGRRLLSSTG